MSPVWRVPVGPGGGGAEAGDEREVRELCRRALGGRGGLGAAAEAADAALAAGASERLERLALALRECRRAGEDDPLGVGVQGSDGRGASSLAEAVSAELASANRSLPGRQREALALRELLGLSHEQIGRVIGIDVAAVAALLARSRLALRAELRGRGIDGDECGERDRALRALARRQDGEAAEPEEQEWIRDHMADCPACERAHAAMLEASVCYRAWEPGE